MYLTLTSLTDQPQDIYGHESSCTKDIFYDRLAGIHFHLADVIDKPEYARKRKVLSSAYALKNFKGWEHKVSDKTDRFIRSCDAHCTAPLSEEFRRPDPKDLTFDYRVWTIADIGLSGCLGFLDQGHDLVRAESM